jgi:hypothetical protein
MIFHFEDTETNMSVNSLVYIFDVKNISYGVDFLWFFPFSFQSKIRPLLTL